MQRFTKKTKVSHPDKIKNTPNRTGLQSEHSSEVQSIIDLQRTAGNQAVRRTLQAKNDGLEQRLNHTKGSGSSLSEDVRAFVEPRLQFDFSNVRVHADAEAARLNQELGTRAFTRGRDIYFGSGQYSPQSYLGRRLLTHELVHVMQQVPMVSNYPIFGDWLEDADPGQSDFWEELRESLANELDNYLSNIHGEAVDTWIQHMNSRGESGAGNLVINILKTAVGLAPGGGNIASAIIGTVQDIYNYIEQQTPRNRVSFNDFVSQQARAHTRFSQQITNRSHRLFGAVDALRRGETAANRTRIRQQALREARSGRSRLPSFDRVYRSLVQAWIRGARDSYDTGDWGPEDAGYIYATCNYFHGSSGFANFSAFVDDVERPEGVIATIRQGWEPRGRVNLDELPFVMTITVNEMQDTGTQRGFRQSGTTRFQKQVGNNPLTLVSGSQRLLEEYMSLSTRINARHLTAD